MADPKKPNESLSTDDIKELVRTAITESVTAGMAISREAAKPVEEPRHGFNPQCGECRQKISACGGKHRQIVVYPRNRNLVKLKGWVGVHLNGIRYASNGPAHKITVPADASIESLLSAWEDAEERMIEEHQESFNDTRSGGMPKGRESKVWEH